MYYLTVLNKVTRKSVPFLIMANGEIKINSSYYMDDEETCIVSVTRKFYEHSIDFGRLCKRI